MGYVGGREFDVVYECIEYMRVFGSVLGFVDCFIEIVVNDV